MKAHVLVIPRKTTGNAVGRTQAAVNTVVSKVNRGLRDIAVRLEVEQVNFEELL